MPCNCKRGHRPNVRDLEVALHLIDGGERTLVLLRNCGKVLGDCLDDAEDKTHCRLDRWGT